MQKILMTILCIVTSLSLIAQPSGPSNPSVPSVPTQVIDGVTYEVLPPNLPGGSGMYLLTELQTEIFEDSHNTITLGHLVVFSLANSSITGNQIAGQNTPLTDTQWTTMYSIEYDLASPALPLSVVQQLLDAGSQAHLVFGRLDGPVDSTYAIAIEMSDVNPNTAIREYYLLPVTTLSPEFGVGLESGPTEQSPPDNPNTQGRDPCATNCLREYNSALGRALDNFRARQQSSASQISLFNVGCFVGCIPATRFGGGGYATCTGGCNLIVSTPGVIDLVTNKNILEFEQENARLSYCSCIEFKRRNCASGFQEFPLSGLGCP